MRFDTRRSIVTAALAALPLLLLPACEDAQSVSERVATAKLEEALAQAAKVYRDDPFNADDEQALAAAGELRRIAQSISSVQGASPGQRSALLMAASSLSRQAAALELQVAMRLEQHLRFERLAVNQAAGGAAGLESLATPLERIDFASARTTLATQREQTEAQLRQFQSQIKALEGAMALIDQQIATRNAEAQSLEQGASQLRLQARELSARQALPLIEQAADLQQRNAEIRGALGLRQSERNAIEPELFSARALGTGGAAMMESTDAALQNLQALTDTARDAANRARRSASEIRGQGKTRIEAVMASMSETLEPRYQAAVEALERAATLASQAASGTDADGADSAKMAQASAQLALARAMWQRAGALEEHVDLLRRLESAGGWGQSSQIAAAIEATQATRNEALERAGDLFSEAVDSLGQLRTAARVNSPEIAGLTRQAQQALRRLGRPEGSAPGGEMHDDLDRGVAPIVNDGLPGAPSVEALVALLSGGADGDPTASARVMRSRSAPQLIDAMVGMATAMEPLRAAMVRQFGSAGVLAAASSAAGMAPPGAARIVSQSETGAEIELAGPGGSVTATAFVEDGRWFLDFDAYIEKIAPGQSMMMAAALPMMTAMTSASKKAAEAIAARVDAGEFASAEEAFAAYQQEMAKAMSGAMGGMGGGF
ncbi:MAG: hypothetical protein KF724_09585 [Phycisphaeraceae bacterium]|nr:hypothetical protein [Phycisphaeraceae bacterium]